MTRVAGISVAINVLLAGLLVWVASGDALFGVGAIVLLGLVVAGAAYLAWEKGVLGPDAQDAYSKEGVSPAYTSSNFDGGGGSL